MAPATLPPEIETLRWADLVARAEDSAYDAAPDADIETDLWNDAESATPALQRWRDGDVQHDQLLFEWERAAEQIAKWQAVQMRVLAEGLDHALGDRSLQRDAHLAVRSLAAEFACAVAMSDRTVEQHMNDAATLRDRFSATFETLAVGSISRAHALVIVEAGARLDDESRAEYERLVLERRGHLTTGRLRAMAAAIAEDLLPVSLAERHAEARTRRRVDVRDLDDGMAELHLHGPSPLVHGVYDRLTQLGRSIQKAEGDASECAVVEGAPGGGVDQPHRPRTLDQLRADILCDLALTGHATAPGIDRDGGAGIDAIHAIVQVTVPVETLIGTRDGGARLAGRSPIDAESARRLAGAASMWHRVLTDPCSGAVLAVDRRFPTEAQSRFLTARDEHCRFPGCRMPVWRCDVDHTIDHQYGGETVPCNLAHLCRRHHVMKHQTAWQVEQADHGLLIWTSPQGRVYTDEPPPMVRFVPA